uniref:Uncharacterized protein n=1 Tax=Anopheles merus TaxID=30066 RepID=A0A182V101_ANOME
MRYKTRNAFTTTIVERDLTKQGFVAWRAMPQHTRDTASRAEQKRTRLDVTQRGELILQRFDRRHQGALFVQQRRNVVLGRLQLQLLQHQMQRFHLPVAFPPYLGVGAVQLALAATVHRIVRLAAERGLHVKHARLVPCQQHPADGKVYRQRPGRGYVHRGPILDQIDLHVLHRHLHRYGRRYHLILRQIAQPDDGAHRELQIDILHFDV